MLQLMRSRAISGFFMAFLVLAAFSLVLTDWTGSFRNGVASTDVAKFDNGEKITQNEFAGLVGRSLSGQNISPQQAYQMGLINRILTTEVWQRLLAHEALAYGVAFDDAAILDHLRESIAPMAAQTKEQPSILIKRFIENQGMSEAAFFQSLRRELANNMMRQIVQTAGPVTSDPMVDALAAARLQQRDLSYIYLPDNLIALKTPDDKTIGDYYDAHKNEHMIPERRSFTLARLPQNALKDQVKITEADIKAAYDDRKESLTKPETRAMTLVLYKTKAEADQALPALKTAKDFAAIARKTGKPTSVTADDFVADTLVPDLAKATWAGKDGDVIGPIATPLGAYVAKLGAIKPAGVQTLAEAKDKLAQALRDERLSELSDQTFDAIDKAVEGGQDFAAIAKAHDMTAQDFIDLTRDGTDKSGTDAFKDLGTVKAAVLTAAFTAGDAGRPLPPLELPNGDIGVLVVKNIVAAAPKPLAEVRDTLVKKWQDETRARDNLMAAQETMSAVVAGKMTMSAAAAKHKVDLKTVPGATLTPKDLPQGLDRAIWDRLFKTVADKPVFQPVPGGLALAVVTKITLPKADDIAAAKEKREAVRKDLINAQTDETVLQFMGALNDRHPTQINDRLIKQMYAGTGE